MLLGRVPDRQAPFPRQRGLPEVLRLACRWDAVGRLALFPKDEVVPRQTAPITAVPKDEEHDRLILDRRGRNA
eukprot:8625900-Lingulodinium_polyedra.AAC.1